VKQMAFKQPRHAPALADEWVKGNAVHAEDPPATSSVLVARLTIDLPIDLRDQFKAVCALRRTKMVNEVRRFIEEWVKKHGNP
jgi:hypothetical protein